VLAASQGCPIDCQIYLTILQHKPKIHSCRKQAARAPAASALSLAAQMANVSFRNGISAEQLQDVICHTSVPMHLMPQVYTFLEEAPVSLLARVVEELHSDCAIERWQIWQNMRDLARSLKSSRALWV